LEICFCCFVARGCGVGFLDGCSCVLIFILDFAVSTTVKNKFSLCAPGQEESTTTLLLSLLAIDMVTLLGVAVGYMLMLLCGGEVVCTGTRRTSPRSWEGLFYFEFPPRF